MIRWIRRVLEIVIVGSFNKIEYRALISKFPTAFKIRHWFGCFGGIDRDEIGIHFKCWFCKKVTR